MEEITSTPKKTLKDIVNTPFKKAMFVIQIISYVLIPGSPFIGAKIGHVFNFTKVQTGLAITIVFIIGEVLFYGSLFFLGKELLQILKSKFKSRFTRSKKPSLKDE